MRPIIRIIESAVYCSNRLGPTTNHGNTNQNVFNAPGLCSVEAYRRLLPDYEGIMEILARRQSV